MGGVTRGGGRLRALWRTKAGSDFVVADSHRRNLLAWFCICSRASDLRPVEGIACCSLVRVRFTYFPVKLFFFDRFVFLTCKIFIDVIDRRVLIFTFFRTVRYNFFLFRRNMWNVWNSRFTLISRIAAKMKISFLIAFIAGSLVTGGSANGNDISGAKVNGHPIVNLVVGETTLSKCPKGCTCTSLTVDCSGKGFLSVPQNLPTNVERL